MNRVSIIGAGLAGCEAAYQLAKANIKVDLYEQKPHSRSEAHSSDFFAELVCSNSFRSDAITNAIGILKNELRILDSLIMRIADQNSVPSGSSLAVDRDNFARDITEEIRNNKNINVINKEVTEIIDGPLIIATGPLTSDSFSKSIKNLINMDSLYFYDAAAPIIEKESIDFSKAYYKSRYSDQEKDYINCPMTKEEFFNFYQEVIKAEVVPIKSFEKEKVFEGCMPFETMAKRGFKTLLFGPMKPVGLEIDNYRPYAVVQLRQDNAIATLYNIVGFQTHLTWPEQKRIIRLIPGLENANIVRYGVMHRNTFINAPKLLKNTYQLIENEDIFFAGQISGVEGYIESCASGMLAAFNMALKLKSQDMITPTSKTIIGSMANYITNASQKNFQPMNANFGICEFDPNINKAQKKQAYYETSIELINDMKVYLDGTIFK